jgi:hypothetical protein
MHITTCVKIGAENCHPLENEWRWSGVVEREVCREAERRWVVVMEAQRKNVE